jgi:hypothetical protein
MGLALPPSVRNDLVGRLLPTVDSKGEGMIDPLEI